MEGIARQIALRLPSGTPASASTTASERRFRRACTLKNAHLTSTDTHAQTCYFYRVIDAMLSPETSMTDAAM
jgi:hypothetical protein